MKKKEISGNIMKINKHQNNSILHYSDKDDSFRLINREIDDINKDKNLLHIDFLKDKKNWSIIEVYFLAKNIKIIPEPDSTELDELIDQIFWIDLNKSIRKETSLIIHEDGINNINFSREKFSSHFNEINYNTDKKISSSAYKYYFSPYSNITVTISHKQAKDKFTVSLFLHNEYIHGEDFNKMNPKQQAFYTSHMSAFDKVKKTYSLNKEGLSLFATDFIKSINQTHVTTDYIVNKIKKECRGNSSNAFEILFSQYTQDKVDGEFYAGQIFDFKNNKGVSLFDYEQAYLRCLIDVLYPKIPYFLFLEEIHHIALQFDDHEFMPLSYSINIQGNHLILQKDGITILNTPKNNSKIADLIVDNIQTDFYKMLKEDSIYEEKMTKECNDFFQQFFEVEDIVAQREPLHTFSGLNIIKRNFDFHISYADDILKKQIQMGCIENLENDKELIIFREKIKIKSALKENNNDSALNNKKRL